jgi:hypothetical protein
MKIVFILILFSAFISAQSISNTSHERIVKHIITNSEELEENVFSEELLVSNRFGIKYEGVNNKFFIANDLPFDLTSEIIKDNIKYESRIENAGNHFSSLTISIPIHNIRREYILKDSFIVSKPYYYSRNWKTISSEHFRFFVSDEALFNDYSINQLEKFVTKMFDVLSFTKEQKELIRQNKVYYFLCKDEDEIKKVTGFTTRGIYMLAQDYVVTTFNTHYHELLHFLINFKLKSLPLYTHPFLQEGLAVAFGGRGGLDAHTIFETGVFLVKSDFSNYSELLNRKDFQNTDATISYPVSGLYVYFLIKQVGIEKFIGLYKKYSASKDLNLVESIDKNDLPSDEKWNLFVDSLVNENPIQIVDQVEVNMFDLIIKKEDLEVYQNKQEYLFRVKDTLLISSEEKYLNYQSKIFKEHLPNKKYNSEKYLIVTNQNEISIYNLYSNNLIGKYVASFSIPPKEIKKRNGYFEFLVMKELFDEVFEKVWFD